MDNCQIDAKAFVGLLAERGCGLLTGVPDSLLSSLIDAVEASPIRQITAANEGQSVAIASGWYLATGTPAVVYMQNSGMGNAANSLISLNDPAVYSIPVFLIIGWRGEPEVHDEPQHVKQGLITRELLETMGIPYEVLEPASAAAQIARLWNKMAKEMRPVALVVRKSSFTPQPKRAFPAEFEASREEVLTALVEAIGDDVLVATTGKTGRELFEIREKRGEGHSHDFLTVGSMGHASSIALGMSLGTEKHVWCIDGDGAFLMHLGSSVVNAQQGASNYHYVVNVNGMHESTGGQPHAVANFDVAGFLRLCYGHVLEVDRLEDVGKAAEALRKSPGPNALVLRTHGGSRSDLGRPTTSPVQNKDALMKFLQEGTASS